MSQFVELTSGNFWGVAAFAAATLLVYQDQRNVLAKQILSNFSGVVGVQLTKQSTRLIKYFLASPAAPELKIPI